MQTGVIQMGPCQAGLQEAGAVTPGAAVSSTAVVDGASSGTLSFRSSWNDSLLALEAQVQASAHPVIGASIPQSAEAVTSTEFTKSGVSFKTALRGSPAKVATAESAPAFFVRSAEGTQSTAKSALPGIRRAKNDAEEKASGTGNESGAVMPSAILPVPPPTALPVQTVKDHIQKQDEPGHPILSMNEPAAKVKLSHQHPQEDMPGASQSGSATMMGMNDAGTETISVHVPSNRTNQSARMDQNQPYRVAAAFVAPTAPTHGNGLTSVPLTDANAAPFAMPPPTHTAVANQAEVFQRTARSPDLMRPRTVLKTPNASAIASSALNANWSPPHQPFIGAQDANAPAGIRNLNGTGGTGSPTDTARGLPVDNNSFSRTDPLSVLDADRGAPPAAWFHAGTHHAEAGYLDPSLGWVGVKADSVAGGVHASVVPGSPEAAQVLGSHLSGLNSFLAEQHPQTATVSIAAPPGGQDDFGLTQGTGSNTGHADRHNPEQGGSPAHDSKPVIATPSQTKPIHTPTAMSGPEMSGGIHISVLA
ncbi:MAG TPA: hypothetical protein VGG85_00940 [Terracidiphilus sp.]